jgi:YHS domain-containing protein
MSRVDRYLPSSILTLALIAMAIVLVLGCGSEKSSEPDTTPPATVSDLVIGATGCDNVTLTWTAPGDDGTEGRASSYDVRYSTATITAGNWAAATQSTGEPAPKAAGQQETFSVENLTSGTPYYFAMKATDSDGNESGISNVCTSTVGSTTIAWVKDGLAEDIDWTNNPAALSANWAAAACADEYEYAIGTAVGGTDIVGWTSAGSESHATRTGLTLAGGETYYFSARAVVDDVPGAPTSSEGITVDLTVPTSQVVALPTEESALVFTVSWGGVDSGSGIKDFDIQVSQSPPTWGTWLEATALASAQFTGVNGHTYYFRSRARDNAGNTEAYPDNPDTYTTVNVASGLTIDWVHDGLAADVDWTNSTTTLSANWAAAAGATGYEYAIGTSSGGTETLDWTSAGSATHVTHSGLTLVDAQNYYFSVRALSGATQGPVTTSNGLGVDATAPFSYVSTMAPVTTTEVLSVTWGGYDTGSGLVYYDVQVKVDGGSWADWLTSTPLAWSQYTGEIDHTYSFRCRAVDNVGNVEAYPATADAWTCITCQYMYSRQWGTEGTGDGYFKRPFNVAVDALGNVYTVESDNSRVQVFDSDGNFLRKWGSHGSGDGQFRDAAGVAIDDSGYVYVTDFSGNRVEKFLSDSTFQLKWGSHGSGDGEFTYPRGIAVDDSFYVYVVDQGNNRVEKFTSKGNFVKSWGSLGTADGELKQPLGLAVGPAGTIYVMDSMNDRVQEFTSDGVFLNKWGTPGTGNGQFFTPEFVAVDADGHVYVADYGLNCVQRFTSDGRFLNRWGSPGSGPGQFGGAFGIAVGPDGSVYVMDLTYCCIQKFAPTCP